jgi:hypothetical protein
MEQTLREYWEKYHGSETITVDPDAPQDLNISEFINSLSYTIRGESTPVVPAPPSRESA